MMKRKKTERINLDNAWQANEQEEEKACGLMLVSPSKGSDINELGFYSRHTNTHTQKATPSPLLSIIGTAPSSSILALPSSRP